MSYFLKVTEPEQGSGQLQKSYEMLQSMFQMVPKVFVAQSIRTDLLEVIVTYVNRLMIEDPDSGISPGTPFEDLTEDWECPVCGVGKDQFEKID